MRDATSPNRLVPKIALAFLAGFLMVTGPALPTAAAQQVAPAVSTSPRSVPARYVDAVQKAQSLILEYMATGRVPGLSVAVGVNGQRVWSEGFGFADLENRVSVTPLTRFRVGSIAKPLTAASVALLWEQGKLDLDAPVQRYVPSFPKKTAPITTRQLAGHLSGIRHYRFDNRAFPDGNEFHSRDRYDNVLTSLKIFQDDSLLFAPGTRFSYSTYGWNLISAVVEGASGVSFLEYMRQNVFEPLGMESTTGDLVDSIIPYRTRFYEWSNCEADVCTRTTSRPVLLNGAYVDLSNKWAGGGFLSNPEDLLRFGFAHLRPGFLKAETLKLLHTSQRTTSGEETGYGIGWQIAKDRQGFRTLSHGGGSVGGTSILLLYPDQNLVFAMQANLTAAEFGDLPERIAHLFMGH